MRLGYTTVFFTICFVLLASGQTRNLSGKVVNNHDATIIGATINLEPDKHIVKTDKDGHFLLENLFPGTYYLEVIHQDHLPYSTTVIIPKDRHTSLNITLQPKNQIIDEVTINQTASELASPDQLMKLSRSAMPMQVISRQTIEMMGSRRLDEVLKEQTGIAIVNNIAGGSRSVGVQVQGFGSEYVMVLIDGQPMVGRNNGNFDLSRISVSNIERIEIIKGASSCLFGSDALGGAINIITRYGAVEPQARLGVSYGSLRMIDATLDAEAPFRHQRGSVQLSTNYYRTDGFNTNPYLISGQSSPPYSNFDTQTRIRYQLANKTYIGSSIRCGLRRSEMAKNRGDNWNGKDHQDENDINYSLTLDHTFRSGWRSMSRYYFSHYMVDQFNRWNDQPNSSELVFTQDIHRFEQQLAKSYRNGINLTGGFGGSIENMTDESLGNVPNLSTLFAYVQGDKRLWEKLDVRGGLRYDQTNFYGGKINPSFGMQYYLNEKLSFKTGLGTGFKAPDYRMRYLVFFNPSANYMVIGNEMLTETLIQMQNNGEISEILNGADALNQNLKAEKSTSWNLGTQWKPNAKISLEAGIFLHRLHNQIDPVPVATGIMISQIFSYRNLPKATNQGIEANVQWQLTPDLSIQAGYQYLVAKDLSVKDSIRSGNWPYNQNIHDPVTGASHAPHVSDYWGIVNRSRHMLNVQAFYHYSPWDIRASFRANYRGKYAFSDYNNNGFIDRFDTFVPHHLLLNTSLEKRVLKNKMALRFTVDNLFDFKHQLMPGQPGRLLIAGVSYQIRR